MKKPNFVRTTFRLWWLLFTLTGIIHFSVNAQTPDAAGAKRFAETFFKGSAPQFAPGKVAPTPVLEQRYQSKALKNTAVFAFQNAGGGFALVAQNSGKFAVVGYSPKGDFKPENIPPSLQALIKLYEDSLVITGEPIQKSINSKAVIQPLLDAKGISLNQFAHEYAEGCPTGCVATAFAQIMAYYQFPEKGVGSHCYTHPKYGQLCADFENTTYNWNNPTGEDYKKLSSHVSIAMDMDYCGSPFGSIPSAPDYVNTLQKYFKYHVYTQGSTIKNELAQARPVYVELPGDPVGHAVVVDGYDADDWYHINFGWGGLYDGYYPLYGGVPFKAQIKFSSYPRLVFVSREKFEINKSDSLILVKIHNALNKTTSWDLNTSVFNWKNVSIMNGRVIGLTHTNEYFNSFYNIPDEIAGLTELTYLGLEDYFQGALTQDIFKLTKLKQLQITNRWNNNNTLSFTITPEIGNMTELEIFRLSDIKVTGTLPASIGNLTKLKHLKITDGNLTGTIPVEIGNLVNLEWLQLYNNQLTGAIPASIGNLVNLSLLGLRNNQLTGIIPAAIGKLSKLGDLSLNGNRFTGIEDGEWNNRKLYWLYLSNNQIEGAIPALFKNFTELRRLELQNNKITSVPPEMGALSNLSYIDLDGNKLTEIPDAWTTLTNMGYFSANNNEISKFIEEFSNWNDLKEFKLSGNKLSVFPNSLCMLPNVSKIDLSRNKIEKLPGNVELLVGKVGELYLQNNEICDSLPLSLMTDSVMHFRLDSNRFVYSQIPRSDKLKKPLGEQKFTKLSKNTIKVMMGDTVRLDMAKLYPFGLPDDKYYWNLYPKNLKTFDVNAMTMNPVMEIIIDEKTIQNQYYCKILNENSPKYFYKTYYQDSYNTGYAPCIDYLNSEPISFVLATDMEKYAEKYGVDKIVSSLTITKKTVEDKTVTLVPPMKTRGTLIWQASPDGKTWYDVSSSMNREDLKANLLSVKPNELVLSPKTPAYYRCSVQDVNCEPLYSDTLKVNPFGKVLYDETINTTTASKTVKVDSIEVTLPKGIYDKDFRLTIAKLDNPPVTSDTVKAGSVYDVTVSFGEVFEMPLLIKLKTLDKTKFEGKKIHGYKAAYFDEINKQWVNYDKSYVSLQDTALYFETNHLTKLRTVQDQGEYDRLWERNNIRVYYKDADEQFINLYKNKKEPWHVTGTPIMVQDVAQFLAEVMIKFTKLGLEVPQVFSVYIKEMDDDGVVGLLGIKNGYMTINRTTDDAEKLRSLLAHEYMHYTQSGYISPDPGNIFWMEANGHLSDRLVWDEAVIPISESEKYLLDGRKFANSIFNFLAHSWDYWDKGFWSQNLFGNVNYCYLAGTFLHYMRTYTQAENKLNPVALLKETTQWSGDSWRQYLSNYIAFSMNSNIGDEYENFVKYIIEGGNSNFQVQREDNPYGYFIRNSLQDSKNNFASNIFYRFLPNENEPQKEEVKMTLPYLSSRMLMLSNSASDRPVVVTYKPLHEWNRENKVYYGYYDFPSKRMKYVDITDSLSYTMFIEARTEITKKEFRNIAFLLFINKQNPSKSATKSDFEASFELNAMPVMNIEDIALADISNKNIHTYSDGKVTSFTLSGRLNLSYIAEHSDLTYKELSYNTSKSIVNDSCYKVTVNFSYHLDQAPIINEPSGINIYDIEQIIVYNFKAGEIDVKQKTTNTSKIKDWMELPSRSIRPGGLSSIYEDYQHVTFSNLINPETISLKGIGEAIRFRYETTAETKASVKINAHTMKRSFYNADGTVNSVESSHYVSTDYSEEGIDANLFIHYK